jgi:hypothetical protein
LRHLSAIPANSEEFGKAKELEIELRSQETALTEAAAAKQQAKASQSSALDQLRTDLKNLGYDLTVEGSETPGEVIITSPEFDDTDHRVRFLSFIRGKNAPTASICVGGFTQIRLKSWKIPLIGLNDAYSLDCFR